MGLSQIPSSPGMGFARRGLLLPFSYPSEHQEHSTQCMVFRHISAARVFRALAQKELCFEQGEEGTLRFSPGLAFASTSPYGKSSPASLGFPASH